MTRFARAKGSKASNEKKPEEATSWSEIKNSMLSKKSSKVDKPSLEEKTKFDAPKQTEWASLGNSDNSVSLLNQHIGHKGKSKNAVSNSADKIKSKMHKEAVSAVNCEVYESNVKKNKKRKFESDVNLENTLSKKKKKFLKSEQLDSDIGGKKQENEIVIDKGNKNFTKVKKIKKSDCFKKELGRSSNSKNANKNCLNNVNRQPTKKAKKFKNKSFTKKKSEVDELIINGEKIPIVKFQGFNVTLEDAERLKKLRNEMIKEGIPKAKLKVAIKLERRRAEKALSRLKKSVCFHCRGHGHLLSNCPSLTEKENTSTGICYKCGSSEHSATDCKVVRGTNYQFAECFICNEQGHIARQCPDNPRGLYPQGGACRECGDVTHLRKDCPQLQAQKEEKTVTVGVTNGRDLECLDEEISSKEKQNIKKKAKKSSTVKF